MIQELEHMLRLYGAKLGYLLYHRISLLPRAHCMVFLSFGCAFVNILWFSKTAVPFFIYFFFLARTWLQRSREEGAAISRHSFCLGKHSFHPPCCCSPIFSLNSLALCWGYRYFLSTVYFGRYTKLFHYSYAQIAMVLRKCSKNIS